MLLQFRAELPIDYERCTSCGQCMDVCPVDAITGTKNGTNYYFVIRAFHSMDNPAADVTATSDSYRIIFFNIVSYFWGSPTKNSGLCQDLSDSIGVYGGCHIINNFVDSEREIFCGNGCPEDAIWQDSLSAGPRGDMIYIDYDKCTSCGVCFAECWNYNLAFSPSYSPSDGGYQGMKSIMHKVVPSGWITIQPLRP